MVLQPAAPYKLDAEGSDAYRDFMVSQPFEKDTYVKAMDFAPGNPGVVHHIITFLDLTGTTSIEKEGKSADGQPGWQVSGAGERYQGLGVGFGLGTGNERDPASTWCCLENPERGAACDATALS